MNNKIIATALLSAMAFPTGGVPYHGGLSVRFPIPEKGSHYKKAKSKNKAARKARKKNRK